MYVDSYFTMYLYFTFFFCYSPLWKLKPVLHSAFKPNTTRLPRLRNKDVTTSARNQNE